MKITLIGATGSVGGYAARFAVAEGHDLTVLVRDPNRLPPDLGPVRIIQGDVRNVDDVAAAVKGQDAVAAAIGPRLQGDTGVMETAGRNLVEAMERCGVLRISALSSALAGDAGFFGNEVLRRIFFREIVTDCMAMENEIIGACLDFTIVRGTRFRSSEGTGPDRIAVGQLPGSVNASWSVTRRRAGEFLIETLEAGSGRAGKLIALAN